MSDEEKSTVAYVKEVKHGNKTSKGTDFTKITADSGEMFCITTKYCKIQPNKTYTITYREFGGNKWVSGAVAAEDIMGGKEKPTPEQKKAPPTFDPKRYDLAKEIVLSLISGCYGEVDFKQIPKDIEAMDAVLENVQRGNK